MIKRRTKKPFLCRLGLHKADKFPVTYLCARGRHKYRASYILCKRCGKKLHRVTWKTGY